jgi:hypothetical protein
MSKASRLPLLIGCAQPYLATTPHTIYRVLTPFALLLIYTVPPGHTRLLRAHLKRLSNPGGSVTWPIQYCMAEPIEEYCTARFSLTNLGDVVGTNVIKAACVICLLLRVPLRTALSTVGDAVTSFLNEPYPTTEKMCKASMFDFRKKRFWQNPPAARPLSVSQQRWWRVVSWQSIVLCVLCWLGFGGFYLGFLASEASLASGFARL